MATFNLEIGGGVKSTGPAPADFYYRPEGTNGYADVAAACAAVPVPVRIGRTVLVEGVEYVWGTDTSDGGLTLKAGGETPQAPVDFRIAYQPGVRTYPLPAGATAVFGVVADENMSLFRLRGDFTLDIAAGTITFSSGAVAPLGSGDYIYATVWTGVGAGNGSPGYVQDGYVEYGYVN